MNAPAEPAAAGKKSHIPLEMVMSQLITAAITVAAVFLAAQVGFEQTIRYTRYQEATDTVLILKVVGAELEDNVRTMEAFDAYVAAMPETSRLVLDRLFTLRTQAFDGAIENDMYYRQGPDVIIPLRHFYDEAAGIRVALDVQQTSVGPGDVKIGYPVEVVQEKWAPVKPALERARKEVLPAIARRIADLEAVRREMYGEGTQPVPGPTFAP